MRGSAQFVPGLLQALPVSLWIGHQLAAGYERDGDLAGTADHTVEQAHHVHDRPQPHQHVQPGARQVEWDLRPRHIGYHGMHGQADVTRPRKQGAELEARADDLGPQALAELHHARGAHGRGVFLGPPD